MALAGIQHGQGPAHWAGLSVEESLAELSASRSGLDPAEAEIRLAAVGANVLPRATRPPWYVELGRQFVHLFAFLLWAGALLAWLAGLPQLTVAIIVVIVVNGVFSYWQEHQAERAAEALERLLPRQVTVRRGDQELLLPAEHVVPGDLLILTEGESVPADARVIHADRLRLVVAALTGESRPVPRTAEAARAQSGPSADLPNLVFAGTTVGGGRGEAVVFATGAATEFGRIARLAQGQQERPSPLERELRQVTRVVTLLAVGLGMLAFALGTTIGGLPAAASFVFAIGIIVANVPEGLLPTLTLALAIGVRRMAARNALVKRLSAVEALGATTLILTDKTGTLTENLMTVREIWAGGVNYSMTSEGLLLPAASAKEDDPWRQEGDVREALRIAALCCDARLLNQLSGHRWEGMGDPTELALLAAADQVGFPESTLRQWPRVAELPFDSSRKRMTTIQQNADGLVACVKGAPEEVLPRCTTVRRDEQVVHLDGAGRERILGTFDRMARQGLRVLAVASRPLDPDAVRGPSPSPEAIEAELTFVGLIALEDPPRPDVAEAIAACRAAGIRVIMVTGDDGRTAMAIGREIGLHTEDAQVVDGSRLDAMDEAAIGALVADFEVLFARAMPEHKLRLVEVFQRRGDVVAVTGDGVNDAPALKRADVGVAMGLTGTDVAREAADMVLADDNFASIVAAIREGRAVYDNVRRFVTYIFASNAAEMAPFMAFALFHIPLPLTVMQVLAVDVGTDLLPALALGVENPEQDVMERPPRSRSQRLLDLPTLVRAYAWQGMLEAVFGLGGFFFSFWLAGWRPGEPIPSSGPLYLQATTMCLAGIVGGQVGNAFACRSTRASIFRLGLHTNRALILAIVSEVLLLAALVHVPPLAEAFGLASLTAWHWIAFACFGPLLLAAEEARKWLLRTWLSGAWRPTIV